MACLPNASSTQTKAVVGKSGARAVVLGGRGKVFCAGMDLERRQQTLGTPTSIEPALRAVEGYPLPVVAVAYCG